MTTGSSWTIRTATPQDAADILECLREAFQPYRSAYTPGAFADTVLSPETLDERFTTMTILVASGPDDALLGTIAAGVGHCNGAEPVGHLRGMAVRSAAQGAGTAAHLLASAESLLRERGCRRITLDTTAPLTRAIAFYRRHGYAATGRVQDFYGMPLYEYARDFPSG